MGQGVFIALGAQAADDADGEIREVGMLTERFPGVNIGQMHFDEGDFHRRQGIAQRHAGVGEGSRIDDDERSAIGVGGVDAVDQHMFGVALQPVKAHASGLSLGSQAAVDVGQGVSAIQMRFAHAQHVQVGAMQRQHIGGGRGSFLLGIRHHGREFAAFGRKKSSFSRSSNICFKAMAPWGRPRKGHELLYWPTLCLTVFFMQLSDFDFELPEALIAQFPPATRGDSRLLHVDGLCCTDDHFSQLSAYLRAGDVLVFNDTRVLKARLFGQKASGGQVEILVERVLDAHRVLAHVRASKSPKPGSRLLLEGRWQAEMVERQEALFLLRFLDDANVLDILEQSGKLPLPPYITRDADSPDDERYQTVYARHQGAVAAPTAGLHFTDAQLDALRAQGVKLAFVTLHVGAGTFQPVRVDNIAEHHMHSERYDIPPATVEAIAQAHANGGRVAAVGTTSLRALESAARGGELAAGQGETDIFITPGYRFRVVDRLLTNFHLPKSTLMMLVSAFAGMAPIRAAYRHAIEQQYRFFSYGDAMLLEKSPDA